jgi:hypothetical protein
MILDRNNSATITTTNGQASDRTIDAMNCRTATRRDYGEFALSHVNHSLCRENAVRYPCDNGWSLRGTHGHWRSA